MAALMKQQYQTTTTIHNKTREHRARVGVVDYIIDPSLYEAAYAGVAGFGLFVAIVLCFVWYTERPESYQMLIYAAVGFGIFCAGIAGHWRLKLQIERFEEITRVYETEEQKREPVPTARPARAVEPARIPGPLATAVISQPRPAAMRRLVTKVLDEANRMQFSVRACNEYQLDYDEVIGELRRAGVLHAAQTINGSPALTTDGRRALTAWLKGLPYPS